MEKEPFRGLVDHAGTGEGRPRRRGRRGCGSPEIRSSGAHVLVEPEGIVRVPGTLERNEPLVQASSWDRSSHTQPQNRSAFSSVLAWPSRPSAVTTIRHDGVERHQVSRGGGQSLP